MAMDIGDAKLIVTADTENAQRKLKAFGQSAEQMSAKLRKVGIAMVAMGAAIAGAMIKMTMDYAKAGDEIAKMAKRTGLATETLSKWKYMADLSGTSLGSMEKAIRKLSMSMSDAKDGLATYTREFDKIGVSVKELEGLSPEDQFMRVAMAVAAIEDPMQRAASAQKLFGRAGTELLPMLEEGEAGLRALSQAAAENAIIFDVGAAAAAEKFNDSITTLKASLAKMGAAIAEEVMPDIQKFIEGATKAIQKTGEWIEKNPLLVGALKALVAVLIGGGGLLIAFSMLSKAIMAVNAALIIMHSISGIGLLKVLGGLAAAAAAIAGMQRLMPGGASPGVPNEIPAMGAGGIVRRPTLALIGERGPEAVTPLGNGGIGGNVNVNLQGGLIFLDREEDIRRLAWILTPLVKDYI